MLNLEQIKDSVPKSEMIFDSIAKLGIAAKSVSSIH
jgi:hypothetical protein